MAAITTSKTTRICRSLPDEEWIQLGVRRVLSTESSGRGFLELLDDQHGRVIDHSLYFEALKSARRGQFAHEVSHTVYEQARHICARNADPFADVKSLNNYDIYAGDGHYIEHACHDPKIDECTFATGGFFGADLRSHALNLLTISQRGGKRKREHDVHALKRLTIEALRNGAPTGRKVIWVWDRAGVDAGWWQKIKKNNGVYFVSRAKSNMNLTKIGDLPYDSASELNAGVTAFDLVTVASQALRSVRYICSDSGREYVFLTSLTDIEPGVIAALYRARWNIEKVFDETKRKLREAKSWASSENAKIIHAEVLCLTHNLLLILENDIAENEDITNHYEQKRREKRYDQMVEKSQAVIHSSLVRRIWLQISQRTLGFIRWVRNSLYESASWESIVERLERRYDRKS